MIDAARAQPWPLAISDDEDLTVHVYVDGAYHRRIPTLSHTACGKPVHSQFSDPRREELCHPLCTDGCFTEFELRIADERTARERP